MDTNHVTAWEARNPALVAKLNALPKDTVVCTSSITLGEMAASYEMTNGDPPRRHRVKQWLNIYVIPYAVKVSEGTAPYYGNIMGRIWKKWPPARITSTENHLRARGVDINDIWITACAWEHGLTLLTTDAMQSIRDVTPEVTFDNWC